MDSDDPPQSDETMRMHSLKPITEKLHNSLPSILIRLDPVSPKIWELKKGEYRIGRNSELEITVDTRGISRHHATILVTENSVSIVDNDSTNGVMLNSLLVKESTLKANDMIVLGDCTFKFIPEGHADLSYISSLYKSSQTDELTACMRKEPFLDLMANEFKRFKKGETDFSMLFIDLDNFKNINDFAGHLGGDFILKSLAEIMINKMLRSTDNICRYGGDEFIVHLPNSNAETAKKIANRAKSAIEEHKFVFEDKILKITISAGVAQCKPQYENINQLIREIDEKMYQAKKFGRNKVVC